MKKIKVILTLVVGLVVLNSCTDNTLSDMEKLSDKQVQFIEKDDFEEPEDRQS